MTHGEAAHERGTHNMFTGYRPSPALIFPSMGSVVSHEFGPRNNLPPYVCVPSHAEQLRRHRLSELGVCARSAWAPIRPIGGFKVRDLNLPGGVDDERFTIATEHARRGERPFRREGKGRRARGDGHLLSAGLQPDQFAEGPRGFNINAEPAAIRDEYGRNAAGQRMLLARRLVAAGVRFVSLTYGGWDMHTSIKAGHGRPVAARSTRPLPR